MMNSKIKKIKFKEADDDDDDDRNVYLNNKLS